MEVLFDVCQKTFLFVSVRCDADAPRVLRTKRSRYRGDNNYYVGGSNCDNRAISNNND